MNNDFCINISGSTDYVDELADFVEKAIPDNFDLVLREKVRTQGKCYLERGGEMIAVRLMFGEPLKKIEPISSYNNYKP